MIDITEFSEDELLDTIKKILSGRAEGVRLGPGDDAALLERGDRLEILTVDMMVDGVHFNGEAIAPRDLGHKALSVNVSDVAAMGGSPRFGLVALGIPSSVQAAWVVELFGGLRSAADQYAMSLVGGDLSRSDRIVVSVTVSGEVAPGGEVTRSGARPGDRIVVTGELGGAAGGLLLAQADPHSVSAALSSDWGRELLAAHFRPVARVGEGQTLAQMGATAMIDISDGLAKDLWRLCRESQVSGVVHISTVPVAPSLQELQSIFEADVTKLALHGGEDFELLATLPAGAVEPAAATLRDRFAVPLTDVGEIRAGDGLMAVEADGSQSPLQPAGWDHFAVGDDLGG